MLIGYAGVSKADGSQSLDLQRDALVAEGVDPDRICEDHASGAKDDRPGQQACLRALREGDVLVVWKLDRLGRNLAHLVTTVYRTCPTAASACAFSPAKGPRSTPPRRVVGWYSASSRRGGVRAGAHPRAHVGGIGGRASAGPEGWPEVRALEDPSTARAGRDGKSGHERSGVVPGTGRRTRDPVPVGRSRRRIAQHGRRVL